MKVVQTLRKVLFVAAALAIAGAGFAAELGTRSSSAAGVTVKVTPRGVVPGADSWGFEVVLDTHSGDLSDDLVGNSVLLDTKGTRLAPLAWEGSGPGGHHRKGVLRFKPPAGATEAIELQIRRPGESAPRSFRWKLK
ncbi:MAG TPA: hypothetical protein VLA30_04800 [Burkholderiales bacterium]|nr:hypothetical protein [Burkholderiales bacterium]